MTAHIIPVRSEFSGIADIYAHARAVRKKLFTKPKKPVVATVEQVVKQKSQPPMWQTQPMLFNEHEVAYRVQLALAELKKNTEVSDTHKSIMQIVTEVLKSYPGITVSEVRGPRRDATLVRARHEAIYEVRRQTSFSLPQIGRWFGGRDHSSILSAVRKVRKQRQEACE